VPGEHPERMNAVRSLLGTVGVVLGAVLLLLGVLLSPVLIVLGVLVLVVVGVVKLWQLKHKAERASKRRRRKRK
jgi:uncharacterized membrane protein